MTLSIGDRVAVGDELSIFRYMSGVVCAVEDKSIGVEFDNWYGGHGCDGEGEEGKCWWFLEAELRLLSAQVQHHVEWQTTECVTTPDGIDQHAPGAKCDKGKLLAGLVLKGFATALTKVSDVGTFGATKYTPNGWKEVDDAYNRYENALVRHMLKHWQGEEVDEESGLTHLAHAAWNMLALIEFKEKENG